MLIKAWLCISIESGPPELKTISDCSFKRLCHTTISLANDVSDRILVYTSSSIHNYETRTQHKIYMLKPNHEYAKNCTRYDIPTTVNNTPNNIIEKIHTHSLQGYSGYIKQHFIQTYHETCSIVNCYICSKA